MALKFIEDLKKKKVTKDFQQNHVPYIIVGANLSSLLLYDHLRSLHGDDKVRIITNINKKITWDELAFRGPDLLRGSENFAVFHKLYPSQSLLLVDNDSQFYKDQEFRTFGGRHRPSLLLEGEEFFIQKRYNWDLSQVVPDSFWSSLGNDTGGVGEKGEILSLKKIETLSSGEEDQSQLSPQWSLAYSDGQTLTCTYLFFSDHPDKLYHLLENKGHFPEKFYQFCLSVKKGKTLVLKFSSDRMVCENQGTLFLPQSFTYDHGNFIGEFSSFNKEKSLQEFSFFCFLKEDEDQPDNISKKIKGLKKNLEKIFPAIKRAKIEESIIVSDFAPAWEIDDSLYDEIYNQCPYLFLIGPYAPIWQSFLDKLELEIPRKGLSNLVREIASFHQVKNFLQ